MPKKTIITILIVISISSLVVLFAIISPHAAKSRLSIIEKKNYAERFSARITSLVPKQIEKIENGLRENMVEAGQRTVYSSTGYYKAVQTSTGDETEEDVLVTSVFDQNGKQVWHQTVGGAIKLSNNGRNLVSALNTSPNCDFRFYSFDLPDKPVNVWEGCYDDYKFSTSGNYFVASGNTNLILAEADGKINWLKTIAPPGRKLVQISQDGEKISLLISRIPYEFDSPLINNEKHIEKPEGTSTQGQSEKRPDLSREEKRMPLGQKEEQKIAEGPQSPQRFKSFLILLDRSGETIAEVKIEHSMLVDAVFSPDGDNIIISTGNSILNFDARTGQKVWDTSLGDHKVRTTSLAYSGDKSMLAVGAITDLSNPSGPRGIFLLNNANGDILDSVLLTDGDFKVRTDGPKVSFCGNSEYLLAVTKNLKILVKTVSE